MNNENTFGDYEFADFIPERTRELIRDFWGCMGRTYTDWIDNCQIHSSALCQHGPGANGFGLPCVGDTADFILRDYKQSKQAGYDLYKIVRGRYVHHWNNIGSIVDEYGESHHVSSCDRWVRVYI